MITPYEMAGFSGGRKSILPGVAGLSAITANHAFFTAPGTGAGKLDGNPVHRLMMEAQRILQPDFILNVVAGADNLPACVLAGDPERAWLAGVEFCRRAVRVQDAVQADVAFVSAGGDPRDLNLYQAVKPTARDFMEALTCVRHRHGEKFRSLVVPQAALLLVDD